jgi:hypothetical protein
MGKITVKLFSNQNQEHGLHKDFKSKSKLCSEEGFQIKIVTDIISKSQNQNLTQTFI